MIKFINKKYFFLVFLLINSIFLNAQDYNKIKNQNTIFIHFKNQNEIELKMAMGSNETNPDRKPYLYQIFHFDSEGEKYKMPLITLHFRVKTNIIKKEELALFRVNKSFLRKNEDIIIDWKFINKIGSTKTLDLFRNAKAVFLIDNEQNNKKTVLVKEVQFIPLTVE